MGRGSHRGGQHDVDDGRGSPVAPGIESGSGADEVRFQAVVVRFRADIGF
jgi:hypothetical protein